VRDFRARQARSNGSPWVRRDRRNVQRELAERLGALVGLPREFGYGNALEGALGRGSFLLELIEAAGRADFVIEAITENFDAKRDLFKRLDGICKEEAILASNTSSIPITRMAAVTRRADRFIGMHFFNPVPVMPLVEITRGRDTAEATLSATLDLAKTLGKTPITSLDYPGFIVNRMLVPFINEAIRALMEGIGTREDIDQGAKLGLHHPMGPLELADFVGLDTHLYICGVLYDGLHDPRFAAPALLQQLVDAGHYGRKTGRGFYRYSPEGARLPD